MLQSAGDLGLQEEAGAAVGVVGVVVEDLLQRDLAMQLGVECHEDGAEAAPGVGPEHAEPQAVGGGGADGVAGGAVVGIGPAVMGRGLRGAEVTEDGLDLGVVQSGQALAGGGPGGDGGQALLGVVAVLHEMTAHQGIDGGAVVGVQVAPAGQVLGQAPRPVESPRLEGSDQLRLVDQSHLEGDEAEEEMAVGGVGHAAAPVVDNRSAREHSTIEAHRALCGCIIASQSGNCIHDVSRNGPRIRMRGPAVPRGGQSL